MELKRLGDYVKIQTGKLDANASSENGKYPSLRAQLIIFGLIITHMIVSVF
jgi:hypothetical protein